MNIVFNYIFYIIIYNLQIMFKILVIVHGNYFNSI